MRNLFQFSTLAVITAICAVSGLVLWQTASISRQIAFEEIEQRGRNTLNLLVENLRGDLEKFRYLPKVLSTDPVLVAALHAPGDADLIDRSNAELTRVSGVSGASDVYLMDATGLTIAASNWDAEKTFVGKNFRYRPYFQQAMDGQLGRYFALGTTSGERGYYFAHPVRGPGVPETGPVVGAVVVKLPVGHHEDSWARSDSEVVVVDDMGVVFMSTRPGWRYTSMQPLPEETLSAIRESRQYGSETLQELKTEPHELRPDGRFLLTVRDDAAQARRPGESFLVVEESIPEAGWRVLLLSRTNDVQIQVRTAVAVAAALLTSLAMAAVALHQRRRRLAERIALQERANSQLERRVEERTEDLMKANVDLQREVAERKRAEDEVRQTQASLVQATKLAALGQMSAGLSHELNQPLAAIRSYADNAKGFVGRGRVEQAVRNLGEISGLTDRMARIIRNLRTYSREEPVELRPVSVHTAIEEALTLLGQRIDADRVEIVKDLPDADVRVIAGAVRLQQVFVNLISNALDAMQDSDVRRIAITVREAPERKSVLVDIADSGQGIREDEIDRLFDPFYSTKEVGKGMGLGLSITYGLVSQFGGTIAAANGETGGAVLSLSLKRSAAPLEAVA